MITPVVQRWRDRRGVYRPAGEVIDTSRFEVAPLASDKEAKRFILAQHYSGSYPAARFRFGLYTRGELVGVAVFSQPVNNHTLDVFGPAAKESIELGRLVLLDEVKGNGESWMLARAFELLRREGIVGVVSFSDPAPRTASSGVQVFPGHIGTIYQALNGTYLGRTRKSMLRLLPDATVLHNRTLAKIRKREQGWRYAVRLLEQYGATPLGGKDVDAWLARWLPRLTRSMPHPGNHRYVWTLHKSARRLLPASQPYPKVGLKAGSQTQLPLFLEAA